MRQMDMGAKLIRMERQDMKAFIISAKKGVMGDFFFQMVDVVKVYLKIITRMEKE